MRIDATLFRPPKSHEVMRCGALLIAEPLLSEPHFQRSVVCLIEHTELSGSLGLVLNRPIGCYLDEIVESVTSTQKIEVFCGGPVEENRLFFIHTLGSLIPNAIPLSDELYIGGDFDTIIAYVNSGYEVEGKVRFFLGYSGWESKQLENEVDDRVWAVAKESLSGELLVNKGNPYWRNMVAKQGEMYRSWLTYPKSAHLN